MLSMEASQECHYFLQIRCCSTGSFHNFRGQANLSQAYDCPSVRWEPVVRNIPCIFGIEWTIFHTFSYVKFQSRILTVHPSIVGSLSQTRALNWFIVASVHVALELDPNSGHFSIGRQMSPPVHLLNSKNTSN